MVNRTRLDDIINLVYQQTSTIGLRIQNIGRKKLPRRQVEVQTSFGPVKAKSVLRGGKEIVTAEFEECRRIAEDRSLPLMQVMQQIEDELRSRT
jgi:uncharacterized protein (DUF111 family)